MSPGLITCVLELTIFLPVITTYRLCSVGVRILCEIRLPLASGEIPTVLIEGGFTLPSYMKNIKY
jgi:hypothetical protein